VSTRIPNAVPCLRGNEWTYLKECLDTNWVSSAGPFVDRFEREVAERVGVPHAVAVVNGSAALHIALLAAGVGAGDAVLVPSLTFIATVNAIAHCGAAPIFMDVEAVAWGMDPDKTAEFLARECTPGAAGVVHRATGRVVRAMLPVHLYGHPCDLDPLLAVARQHGLAVVEDAAEALGARYRGRAVGGDGLAACLSFNGNKIVTAGGGGMVLTRDAALAARVRGLTTQARADAVDFVHAEIAYNYRLTNLQAALGVAQLEQLDAFVGAKRETARHYTEALGRLDGVAPFTEASWAFSTYWMSSVLLDPAAWGDRRALIARGQAAGIELRPLWYPTHRQPAFRGCPDYRVEVADRLHARGVSLPCSSGISADERERVIAFLAGARR